MPSLLLQQRETTSAYIESVATKDILSAHVGRSVLSHDGTLRSQRYSRLVSDTPKPTSFVMNLITTAEVKTGMALYALPGIPSHPAQRMIDPSGPDHPSASAPT